MADINLKDLTNNVQGAIVSINTSIKSNRFGSKTINELTKQKSILSSHISDLMAKGDLNEEDEKNTTRLIAIATSKKLTAQPKTNDNKALITGIVVIFSAVAIFYYFKKEQ
jgi:hypothetical protein